MLSNLTNDPSNNSFCKAQFTSRSTHHVLLVELVAILGIIVAFAGYRLIKLAMFSAGCFLGFAVFFVFSPTFIHLKYCCTKHGNKEVHIVTSLLFGILVGVLVSRLYMIGLFTIGKCFGLLAVLAFLNTPLGLSFCGIISIGSLLTSSSILFGSLTCKYEKIFVILSTSFSGSYAALCGADVFLKSEFSFASYCIIDYLKDVIAFALKSTSKAENAPVPRYEGMIHWSNRTNLSMFAIWMIFFLLSCLVQFQLSAKDLSMGGSICPINFPKQIGRFWKQGESNEDRDKATCLYSNGENGKD